MPPYTCAHIQQYTQTHPTHRGHFIVHILSVLHRGVALEWRWVAGSRLHGAQELVKEGSEVVNVPVAPDRRRPSRHEGGDPLQLLAGEADCHAAVGLLGWCGRDCRVVRETRQGETRQGEVKDRSCDLHFMINNNLLITQGT